MKTTILGVVRAGAILLPRCSGARPETRCTCKGSYLAYVQGGYQHVAYCGKCTGRGPCPEPERHTACDSPEPVLCAHCQSGVVELDMPCAVPHTDGCDGCCWKDVPRAAAH